MESQKHAEMAAKVDDEAIRRSDRHNMVFLIVLCTVSLPSLASPSLLSAHQTQL
jgi:hypothetical protein